MNREELRRWQDNVFEHCQMVKTLGNDRKTLEKLIEKHLSQFFEWDDIIYDKDFNTITLAWGYGHDPVIRIEKLKNLGMDFIISHDYSSKLGDGARVILYPFGLPKEGEYTES